jgi:Peptidase family M28
MGRTRRSVFAVSAGLAFSLALVAPASSRADRALLARIDKVQARVPPASLVATLEVIQELQGAWLVRFPGEMAPDLAKAGLSYEIFDPVSDGDALFLVSSSAPADVETLRQVGAAWPVDAMNSLLVTGDEQARARIPSHLHLKRLSDRLDVTPSFRVAGRSAAVARGVAGIRLSPGSAIPEMVGQVSTQALADTIRKLEAFQTRYASQPSCAAAGAWLFDSFNALGLVVERDDFTFGSYNATNIVATLPGRTFPDQIVIIGAHYDSYSTDPAHLAPGADDNASGTAAVLEIARVLSRRSFDFTIKFVAFSAEEFGLYGSRHFARDAHDAGQTIVGVINLDMIGFTDRLPEDLDLIVNPASEWLAGAFTTAANAYAPLPTLKVVNGSFTRSDHAPFWDMGYSAVCGIEDWNPANTNYHKTYDTFGTLNIDFETSVARASLATIAALAQPFATPPPPRAVTATAQTVGSLFLRAKTTYLSWTAAPGAVGYNVYRGSVSRGSYKRVNQTPIGAAAFVDRLLPADAVYYYVIASLDAGGHEGNYSVEVAVR